MLKRIIDKKSAVPYNYGWFVVAGVFFAFACFGASRNLLAYVLPTMERALDLPHERMGNIASAYWVAYAIMTLVWGIVADRIGARKPMLWGALLIGIGLCGMGFLPSFGFGLLFSDLCCHQRLIVNKFLFLR